MSDGALHFSFMTPVGLHATAISSHKVHLGTQDMVHKSVCESIGISDGKSSGTGHCAGRCCDEGPIGSRRTGLLMWLRGL